METAMAYDTRAETPMREGGQIDRVAAALAMAVKEVGERLNVLTGRLAPVLLPDDGNAIPSMGEPHDVRSPLANQIDDSLRGVQAIERRLIELTSRVDL